MKAIQITVVKATFLVFLLALSFASLAQDRDHYTQHLNDQRQKYIHGLYVQLNSWYEVDRSLSILNQDGSLKVTYSMSGASKEFICIGSNTTGYISGELDWLGTMAKFKIVRKGDKLELYWINVEKNLEVSQGEFTWKNHMTGFDNFFLAKKNNQEYLPELDYDQDGVKDEYDLCIQGLPSTIFDGGINIMGCPVKDDSKVWKPDDNEFEISCYVDESTSYAIGYYFPVQYSINLKENNQEILMAHIDLEIKGDNGYKRYSDQEDLFISTNTTVTFVVPDDMSPGPHTVIVRVMIVSEYDTDNYIFQQFPFTVNFECVFGPCDTVNKGITMGEERPYEWPEDKAPSEIAFPTLENKTNPSYIHIDGNGWKMYRMPFNQGEAEKTITKSLQNKETPVSFYSSDTELAFIDIEEAIFDIQGWNIEKYLDVGSLTEGINTNMNQGYFPVGISFNDMSDLNVFYILAENNATAWQLLESDMNYTSLESNMQPLLEAGYIPVGISTLGGFYYVLMVNIPNSTFARWSINECKNTKSEIKNLINTQVNQNMIPFGYLEHENIVNVLFVGF